MTELEILNSVMGEEMAETTLDTGCCRGAAWLLQFKNWSDPRKWNVKVSQLVDERYLERDRAEIEAVRALCEQLNKVGES